MGDTTATALGLIREHGSAAPLEAAKFALHASEEGDLDACADWIAVFAKIQKFQPPKRKRGARLN